MGVLTSLFGLAPLIACAVVPPGATTLIAGLTVVAAALSGLWDDAMGTAQQNVRILNVVLVSAAAVAISMVRVRREDRFTQMSEIAHVAQRAILPILPTRAGKVAIAARYQSAARDALVGGDLFDCYHSAQHIRLLVGDVRGKGISGVEQAARVIRAFRQSAALQEHLSQVAAEMDDYLADFFGEEEFMTVLLVDVTRPGVLQLVNAPRSAGTFPAGDSTTTSPSSSSNSFLSSPLTWTASASPDPLRSQGWSRDPSGRQTSVQRWPRAPNREHHQGQCGLEPPDCGGRDPYAARGAARAAKVCMGP